MHISSPKRVAAKLLCPRRMFKDSSLGNWWAWGKNICGQWRRGGEESVKAMIGSQPNQPTGKPTRPWAPYPAGRQSFPSASLMGDEELTSNDYQMWGNPQRGGCSVQFSSVQFSRSVVSDSLRPGEKQHARPPCPSPTPRVYSNSCPLSRWCHLTISSSVVPFSSCLQSFPTSESLQISQLFASGGQNIGVSVSTSVLAINTRDWFPLGWTGWILTRPKLTQANKTGIRNLE